MGYIGKKANGFNQISQSALAVTVDGIDELLITTSSLTYSGSAIITGSLLISGSGLLNSPDNSITSKYALKIESGSGAIWSNNINVGYPSANQWGTNLNGSYFNNFSQNTDVSEILRFIAGLLSSSAPDTSPNTKTYNNFTTTTLNSSVNSIGGSVPSGSTNSTVLYLQGKGFANSGSTIFSGITVQQNYTYGYYFSSSAGGATTISSSNDVQLFGLGTLPSPGSSTPATFYVSGSFTWKYSNTSSKLIVSSSSSQAFLSNSTFGTTNGLTIGKINTANPAVIPANYQDGKFAGIFTSTLWSGSEGSGGATGSGWYYISASIAIASGSSAYTPFSSSNNEVFWAPINNIITGIGTQTISIGNPLATTSGSLTAVSRSLSGAPYLTNATYYISSSISGLFNPLYQAVAGVASITSTGVAGLSNSTSTLSTAGGLIAAANANTVYDSTGTTARAINTVPAQNDIVKLNSLATFTPASGLTNIPASGLGSLSPISFTVTIAGSNRTGSAQSSQASLAYFDLGAFAQPAASGGMAYYGRAQGYDGSTYTRTSSGNLSTNFTGESGRLQINEKILSGSYLLGDGFVTSSYVINNITSKDLQIKPTGTGGTTGVLFKPGGQYKYWLNDPDPAQTLKYYAIGFTRDIANATPNVTLTLAGNTTLTAWTDTSTTPSISILLIPQSVLATVSQASGIDPVSPSTTLLAISNAANPFNRSLNVLSNTNAQKTNPFIIDFPSSPNAFPLDTTYRNFVLLVRYNGDPTALTSITITV